MTSAVPFPPSLQEQVSDLSSRITTMTNDELRRILVAEHLPRTGVKHVLQTRIKDRLSKALLDRDHDSMKRLSQIIRNRGYKPPPALAVPTVPKFNPSPPIPSRASALQNENKPTAGAFSPPSYQISPSTAGHNFHMPTYKKSPFYEIISPLTKQLDIRKLEANRETQSIKLQLQQGTVDELRQDSALRLMLYCCADVDGQAQKDVAFPHNVDIKINNEEFKANTRGIKNKPGTTKPADITPFCRIKLANYTNRIDVQYALTKERYFMSVALVRKRTVAELTKRISSGRVISKQYVLDEMRSRADDADIVAMATNLSLKDPVSYLRIRIPVRSAVCLHNQCFDVGFFLELQEQAPTWACPVCNKAVTFENLAVDKYVQDIIERTSHATEQVTVQPNGEWSITTTESLEQANGGGEHNDGSDDDVVDVTDLRRDGSMYKAGNTATALSLANTPPVQSPAPNVQNSGAGSKRRAEVVDLTLSDSDDEPASKRPAYSSNSMPNASMPRTAVGDFPLPTHLADPFAIHPVSGTAPNSNAHNSPFPPPSTTTRRASHEQPQHRLPPGPNIWRHSTSSSFSGGGARGR